MKGLTRLLLFGASIFSAGVTWAGLRAGESDAQLSLRMISEKLTAPLSYVDSVKFTVGMPQLAEDITYSVVLDQLPAVGDKLSPCSYIIDWEMPGRDEMIEGFSAYFDGNHYRYSGTRLQEYHSDWDSIPFMPRELGGLNGDGIHRSAQFVDLLPAMIGEKFGKMAQDSTYSVKVVEDTIVGGKKAIVVRALMIINGITASEAEYVLNPETYLPRKLHFENSPGSVSEQTVDVVYGGTPIIGVSQPELSEAMLIDRYPDIFANYRESNFRIENLPGTKLPAFALPTLSGDRMSRRAGDTFNKPVILALLDQDGGFNSDYIAAIRKATASLPFDADVIWAFTGTNPDRIEEIVGSEKPGETTLISARGLVRDCGAASLPVTLIVGKDGVVRNVILGYNNNLSSDVIQKMALVSD